MHLITNDDGLPRCWWGASSPEYVIYHDGEWGWAVTDDTRLFEKLCLEGFQAGLSWLTILRKREEFRAAFAGFDPHRVAAFGEAEVAQALANPGIVRHEGKIRSTINNARRALELIADRGSLASHFWGYASEAPPPTELVASTVTSKEISRDLKRRGWTFVGPTTIHAFMQAVGLVNDHLGGCWVRDEAERSRLLVLGGSQRGKPR